ncbi:unnamed protein product [Gongylonema pulchrum]|uniref:Uncharacterized protein n=1 Tax=Gongylonema pulchrum TaxID=637853 RepID=A0A183DND7_9BILA|nr:unnamed protein product [Gongylonema pulchrum]
MVEKQHGNSVSRKDLGKFTLGLARCIVVFDGQVPDVELADFCGRQQGARGNAVGAEGEGHACSYTAAFPSQMTHLPKQTTEWTVGRPPPMGKLTHRYISGTDPQHITCLIIGGLFLLCAA